MKLSVIIPVYNCERYLKECLDSIRAQTFKDFEAICVDDGSTDSTAAILEEFAALDPRFKVIHQPNGGQGKARNTGLDNAKGDYIAFVDADDWVEPNYFELLLSFAAPKTIPTLGYVAEFPTRSICRGPDSQTVVEGRNEILRWFLDGEVDVYLKLKRLAFPGGYLWNKLFHCDLFKTLRFDDCGIMEDVRMFIRLADNGVRIRTINAYPYHYRQLAASSVHDMSLKAWKEVYDARVWVFKRVNGVSRLKVLFLILIHIVALYRRFMPKGLANR